jgi:nitroimidazol reductase NimA-like FMN-containing flavoprotein (pyridoxamine 5'-phosphate oxidase superfamily)
MDAAVVWMDDLELGVCWRLLERAVIGRIGFLDAGHVKVLPVNHVVDGRTIVLRTDRDSALSTVARGVAVAFEVDGADEQVETGWSVVVDGITEVATPDSVGLSRAGLHPWAPGSKDLWVRIVPTAVTGRAISRRKSAPDTAPLPYMPPD